MSTKQTLLELAAKAVGYAIKGHWLDESDEFICLMVNRGHGKKRFKWNPWDDDSDAFRLGTNLGMFDENPIFQQNLKAAGNDTANPYARIRLAIVYTAAEVGRNMK